MIPPSALWTVEDVADYMHCSRRVIHEQTRHRAIPMRRLPRRRSLLFVPTEIEAFVADPSMPLEVIELDGNGVIVRPRMSHD